MTTAKAEAIARAQAEFDKADAAWLEADAPFAACGEALEARQIALMALREARKE